MSTFANFIVFYKLSDSSYRTYNYNRQQYDTIKKLCFVSAVRVFSS